jgi:hypothetical protein
MTILGWTYHLGMDDLFLGDFSFDCKHLQEDDVGYMHSLGIGYIERDGAHEANGIYETSHFQVHYPVANHQAVPVPLPEWTVHPV